MIFQNIEFHRNFCTLAKKFKSRTSWYSKFYLNFSLFPKPLFSLKVPASRRKRYFSSFLPSFRAAFSPRSSIYINLERAFFTGIMEDPFQLRFSNLGFIQFSNLIFSSSVTPLTVVPNVRAFFQTRPSFRSFKDFQKTKLFLLGTHVISNFLTETRNWKKRFIKLLEALSIL